MFAIDFKGQTNLLAQEVPSAVGMRGFYIGALQTTESLCSGEFDFHASRVDAMLRDGALRPLSLLPR